MREIRIPFDVDFNSNNDDASGVVVPTPAAPEAGKIFCAFTKHGANISITNKKCACAFIPIMMKWNRDLFVCVNELAILILFCENKFGSATVGKSIPTCGDECVSEIFNTKRRKRMIAGLLIDIIVMSIVPDLRQATNQTKG